jgi:hypothetical protein
MEPGKDVYGYQAISVMTTETNQMVAKARTRVSIELRLCFCDFMALPHYYFR